MRIVGRKAGYRGDKQDTRGFIRLAAVKVVLGQTAYQSIAPKKKRQRLNDSGLSAIVRPDQNGMTAKRNVRRTHSRKPGDYSSGQCASSGYPIPLIASLF